MPLSQFILSCLLSSYRTCKTNKKVLLLSAKRLLLTERIYFNFAAVDKVSHRNPTLLFLNKARQDPTNTQSHLKTGLSVIQPIGVGIDVNIVVRSHKLTDQKRTDLRFSILFKEENSFTVQIL